MIERTSRLARGAAVPHRIQVMSRLILFLSLMLLAACQPSAKPAQAPVILAASSLQEALTEAADAWAAHGHDRPILSFAGSPALARQVESGAPADIVFLADEQWMDVLEAKNALAPATRRALFGNRLVLIAPKSETEAAGVPDLQHLLAHLHGRQLAMADPQTVPAGRYGKAALTALGLWSAVDDNIIPSENVRAALALVERGEAPVGLVYASDLKASDKVRLAAEIPDSAQPPIRYPAAVLASSTSPEARKFLDFLGSGEAAAIFARHGFNRLAER